MKAEEIEETKKFILPELQKQNNEIEKQKEETKKLLDRKIAESNLIHLGEIPESREEFDKSVLNIELLKRDVLSRLESSPTNHYIFEGLANAMRERQILKGFVGEAFAQIETEIRYKFGNESRFLPELKTAAVEYFVTNFKSSFNIINLRDIENDILIEIEQQIKNKINNIDSYGYKDLDLECERFEFAALKKLQNEFEHEFNKRVAVVQQKKQLESQKIEKNEKVKARTYPPYYLQQIIDTAVLLYETIEKVQATHIYAELKIEKNTYNRRIRFFGYSTPRILEEARKIIKDRQISESSKR